MVLVTDAVYAAVLVDREPYGRTEKTIRLSLYKEHERYMVRAMEVTLADIPYEKTYDLFKGKVHNGCIVSFRKETLGCFGIEAMKIILCAESFAPDGTISGGCEERSEGDITASIPYFPNGEYADIYDPEGKKVFTIDLAGKATCDENDFCDQPREDWKNCSQDCRNKEPIVSPHVSQETQKQNSSVSSEKVSWGWITVSVAALIAVGGGILVWRRWKNKDYYY
ncbi:MAG: hypothetical protein WAW00_01755 [Candidatus Moraniibacteriota bacterium]